MNEVSKKEFNFKGCLTALLKLILRIAIPVLVTTFIFDFIKEFAAKDEIAKLLIPLQNDYLMFEEYYLTVESWQSKWILRLLLFGFPPFFFLVLIFGVLTNFIKNNKSITYIIRFLIGLIFLWAVSKAFFFQHLLQTLIFRIRKLYIRNLIF